MSKDDFKQGTFDSSGFCSEETLFLPTIFKDYCRTKQSRRVLRHHVSVEVYRTPCLRNNSSGMNRDVITELPRLTNCCNTSSPSDDNNLVTVQACFFSSSSFFSFLLFCLSFCQSRVRFLSRHINTSTARLFFRSLWPVRSSYALLSSSVLA